mmetsp:Transcript_15656/g.51263  ORF Transcript_15656/g.51263 Transcript_15656/m.51263 type:complete len:356 (-) Transcript_15656:73-1140(-)
MLVVVGRKRVCAPPRPRAVHGAATREVQLAVEQREAASEAGVGERRQPFPRGGGRVQREHVVRGVHVVEALPAGPHRHAACEVDRLRSLVRRVARVRVALRGERHARKGCPARRAATQVTRPRVGAHARPAIDEAAEDVQRAPEHRALRLPQRPGCGRQWVRREVADRRGARGRARRDCLGRDHWQGAGRSRESGIEVRLARLWAALHVEAAGAGAVAVLAAAALTIAVRTVGEVPLEEHERRVTAELHAVRAPIAHLVVATRVADAVGACPGDGALAPAKEISERSGAVRMAPMWLRVLTRRPNARTVGTRVCLANPSAIRCVQASKRVRAGDVARVAAKWQGVEMACRWRPLW